jgi:hypothetical protein
MQRIDQARAGAYTSSSQNKSGPCSVSPCNQLARALVNSSCNNDFRLLQLLQELLAVAGDDSCKRIVAALKTYAPDAIFLHRAVATGSWISFHKDTPGEAVHVG